MNRGRARSAGGHRGRSPRSGGRASSLRRGPAIGDDSECKDGTPPNRMEAPEQPSPGGGASNQPTLGHAYWQDSSSSVCGEGISHVGRNQYGKNPQGVESSSSQPSGGSSASGSVHENHLPPVSALSLKENTKYQLTEFQTQKAITHGINDMPPQIKGPQIGKSTLGTGSEPTGFDICLDKSRSSVVVLKPPLHAINKEKRKQSKLAEGGPKVQILRSGMFLLKGYISSADQVKIVNECRKLGLGTGGFYQPGYRDGAKLNLNMMCLGKNWDPDTSKYGDERPIDHARPPPIPNEFYQLVEQAIIDSHVHLTKEHLTKEKRMEKVEEILPHMKPDICIVNFYTISGRLGLHQDRDESQQSLRNKLPVVSFSIGDSAEFLYSDQRDVLNAKKITLESGDVLIFGGKARDIFHGVSSIVPDSYPNVLKEGTNLRPGRLNLTFREY